MHTVKISAIVPVYRGEGTLHESLYSLLDQDVEGLETIVLDDGSPDNSREIANRIAAQKTNKAIVILSHTNRGLAATLNQGIRRAKGDYVARQDQDDIVLPGRLEKQMAFLDAHPDIAMVGTWAQIYQGDIPTQRYHRHPAGNDALQLELMFDNPFVHSSMMIRTEVLRQFGGYSEDKSRQPPEDYELWSRIARKHRVANLPEILTIYRELPGSMSREGGSPFTSNIIRISAENLFRLLEPFGSYSQQDCWGLANLYHAKGKIRNPPTLTKAKAKQMLHRVATIIGGAPSTWAEEFRASYLRMSAHIDHCFLRMRIPSSLLGPARWLKKLIPGDR
ncbi:MAG: glycosyltransferase [Rhodocyclaceae bacterium]|nr:glycosyltransferase [Rhodocyclaceae bacterium]